MTSIFISHRSKSEEIVKNFVGHYLIRHCGVDPWHIFTTFQGTQVPPGSMTYGRVMGAMLDAPLVLVWADQEYFNSFNCVTELGASIASKGKVFYLLSPEISIDEVPEEFNWISWQYAHDPTLLKDLKDFITNSHEINHNVSERTRRSGWPGKVSKRAGKNLKIYCHKWPKLVESRPIYFPSGRPDAAFGLLVWKLKGGDLVPIVYADTDQSSIMNSDALVEHLKEKYAVTEIFALWPDEEMGVCVHSGGGGTLTHQEARLINLGIPLPEKSPPEERRIVTNYWQPSWFAEWSKVAIDAKPASWSHRFTNHCFRAWTLKRR